jgi:CheY-like chemotaxis protein
VNDYDNVEILLVEDNPLDAEMTIRALRKSSIVSKLYWVKDGVEALDFVRCEGAFADRNAHQVPKLILLDLKMPRIDGLGVLQALKSDDKYTAIPIVAMTSSNQERDVTESYRLGVNGYVTKPVELDEFMQTVANIGAFWLALNQTPTG